ncbi:hypothetical protein P691DRAFT_765877 [Macrolepiota fuliginosa MF-IS2]|uniref:Uncharacterized protein n=1 Tax=Macrolepiota fuliginosa MF-IS2 TaxID=1400762 RepID=A0A9P5WZL3_9AGAR|nr:hypothetical protein P691DRAFT_765877 [Macrolepiota fuliginosa MF-IS2]
MAALCKLNGSFQDRPTEFWECGIPVDSDDAVQDIEHYLHTEFTKIREENPHSLPNPTSPWPSDGDFLKVTKASSGLFVFASTVTKYVSVDHPAFHLKLIMTLIDQSTLHPTSISQKPFSLLDLLRKGLVYACNVLRLCQDEAYDALRKLHSILTCPSPGVAENQGIEYFHASFADPLFNYSRSQEYHVDLDQELTTTWRGSIRILKESYQANAIAPTPNHESVNIQWVPQDDDSLLNGLRGSMLCEAHHICLSLLIKYGHSWCTSCPPSDDGMRLLVDAPEMINTFRSICPVLFYADARPTKGFLNWLDDHAPKAVQEAMISRESPMSQLDTKHLFRSLHIKPWCCQHLLKLCQPTSLKLKQDMVIDLIFVDAEVYPTPLHKIDHSLRGSSDHSPLSIQFPIPTSKATISKLSIPRGSDNEEAFINDVTTYIRNCDIIFSSEDDVNEYAKGLESFVNASWKRHAKLI